MVAARTTDDLIAEVDDQALLPAADGRLTSAEKLRMADRVMRTIVADLMISARQGRWVEAAADVSIVSGTYLYSVPERALAEGVSDVLIVDGDQQWSAPELAVEEAFRYRDQQGPWDSPFAFTWRDDEIEILPHPTSSGYSLRVLYPRRPASLVEVSDCAQVSSATSTVITTAAPVPTAWGSSETLDVVSGTNGRPRGTDEAGTNITEASVTISAGVPTGTASGDYVCLAGQTCVPAVPSVVWPVLVDGTTLEVLRALDDPPSAMAGAQQRLAESVGRARSMLSPRSRGSVRKIVARYSPGRRGGAF